MPWPNTTEYVSTGTGVFTANNVVATTTLSPTAPAHNVGDLLILLTETRSITAAAATPSNWNIVTGYPQRSATASGGSIYLFTRIADGTADDNASFNWTSLATGTSGDSAGARIIAFRYATETLDGAVNTKQDQASTTNFTVNANSPSLTNSLWFGAAIKVSDTAQTATVATMTECADDHTTTGTGHLTVAGYKALTASGSTGTAVITPSNTTSSRTLTTAVCFQAVGMGNISAITYPASAQPIPQRMNL